MIKQLQDSKDELAALLLRFGALQESDDERLELALHAQSLARKLRDKNGFSHSSLAIAQYHFAHYAYQKTIDSIETLFGLPFEADLEVRVPSLLLLTQSYIYLDESRRAVRYASEALSLLDALTDYQYERMRFYGLLATGLTNLGGYYDALEHYKKQLELAKELHIEEPNGHTGLGWVHVKLENYTLALSHFEEAMRMSRASQNIKALTFVYINLGVLYQNLGNYDLARDSWLQALDSCGQYQNLRACMFVYAYLGKNAFARHEVAKAREYYLKAQDILMTLPSKAFDGWLAIHLGQTFLGENDEKAEVSILMGLAKVQATGSSSGIIEAHKMLYEHYKVKGRFAEALEHHKAFSDLTIKRLRDMNEKRTQTLSVQFEVERLKREQEVYKLKNLELGRMIQQLEELSSQDALTGLYNRRFLDKHLRSSFYEALHNNQNISIILSDIDHFKQVNDNFSHATGDEVLRIIGKIFKDATGSQDISARYGGEEFIVVCRHRDLEQTTHLAETIRSKIENYPWHTLDPDLKVTGSFGVCADMQLQNHEKMISSADMYLYEAKDQGRNCVVSRG